MSWEKIKKEYVQGDIGYRPLAEKHKVSFNSAGDMECSMFTPKGAEK